MATRGAAAREHLERLLRVATCLAMCGYGAQVGQLAGAARAFYSDAQVWAALVHHRGKRGRRTHLMHAAYMGSAARVQYLLDRGAAVDAVTLSGATALMMASDGGHLETVRCLVERGSANVNAARAADGHTSLMWASEKGHMETARFLVERGGANVNAAMTSNGTTALLLASQNGHLETVRFLVERGGANVNAAKTTDGRTALMMASKCGHLQFVRFLLQHGADKQAADSAGRTARFYAAAHPLVLAALA